MQEINHSNLLRVLVGEAGDHFISTTSITTKKFTRIKITATATLTDVKLRGVSVKTARDYPSSLPVGYEMIAGGNDYFDTITLSAGSAIGYLYYEEPVVGSLALNVSGGAHGASMSPVITFTNTGGSASKLVYWRTRDKADAVVQSGEQVVYFLKGSSVNVSLVGLTFFASADTGYEVDVRLEGSDTWTACAAFEIT